MPPINGIRSPSMATCAECRWFQPFQGRRAAFGVAIWEGGSAGFESADGGDWGRRYDAMGIGHCEHPERPRGLVLVAYNCQRDFETAPAVDVLAKARGDQPDSDPPIPNSATSGA